MSKLFSNLAPTYIEIMFKDGQGNEIILYNENTPKESSSIYENKVRRCQKYTPLGKCNEVLQTDGRVYWCVNEMIHG